MSQRNPAETFEAGRSDPPTQLADRLSRAPVDYLQGALENPGLDEEGVVLLLRNRSATQEILDRVARHPRYRRSYEVRAGLVRHPASPRGVAMNLVHHLFWRDLARAADDFLVPPPVRRVAVRVLESRLEDMALGERITLARTAGRSVLLALRKSPEESVVAALLDNPRMVEEDAVFLAGSRQAPQEILSLLARSRRWIKRYGVRLALVHNERAPLGVALGLLTGLLRRDLEGIARRPDRPRVLRVAAVRVLRSRGPGPEGDHEPDGSYRIDPEPEDGTVLPEGDDE